MMTLSRIIILYVTPKEIACQLNVDLGKKKKKVKSDKAKRTMECLKISLVSPSDPKLFGHTLVTQDFRGARHL